MTRKVSGGRDKGLSLERAFDEIDDVVRKMGKVAERLVRDRLTLTDGTSEQMGDVGLTLVDPPGRGHMNGPASCWHAGIFNSPRLCQDQVAVFSGYISESRSRLSTYFSMV